MYNGKFKGPDNDDDDAKPVRWYHILIAIGVIIVLGILARHIIII